MNSRFLIPVLCVGAVAFACGPRPHHEAASSNRQTFAAATVRQQGKPSGNTKTSAAKAPVSADLYVHATPASVRLALRVVNTSKKRVELTFPSGQTYDFVILDSLDREVWHWAKGRMFTQTLRNKVLAGGEAMDVDETWSTAALPAGRYTARAELTSENYPIVRQTRFTITGTTVASR